MYHFYFNLPENDKNAGAVYLPMKSSTNLPVIISCYGWDKNHWAKRVEEDFRNFAVNKHGMAIVTMELYGQSGWESNLKDMILWVREKRYFDGNKVGIFAYGAAGAAALRIAKAGSGLAFSIVTVTGDSMDNLKSIKIPTLLLQGTSDKIIIGSGKIKAEEVVKEVNPETKSMSILFKGSDYYLHNIFEQASKEIIEWIENIGII